MASIEVARVSDRTIGYCDACDSEMGGSVVTGSPDTYVNNLPVAREGDLVLGDCGHEAYIVTYSHRINVNGLGLARKGDFADGTYSCHIITGSPDTNAEFNP